jgi:hypothetical protein
VAQSGGVPALQAQTTEFKPQFHQKQILKKNVLFSYSYILYSKATLVYNNGNRY